MPGGWAEPDRLPDELFPRAAPARARGGGSILNKTFGRVYPAIRPAFDGCREELRLVLFSNNQLWLKQSEAFIGRDGLRNIAQFFELRNQCLPAFP
jgi:hypothetical protein